MDAFIGTILLWPINWAPNGWLFCHGQLLAIAQYQALYALIGNTYGGDGRTTFALPDLRGRVVIGVGAGVDTSNYVLGQKGGVETVTLTINQLPPHSHNIPANEGNSMSSTPGPGMVLGQTNSRMGDAVSIYSDDKANTVISPTLTAGEGKPHTNIQPFLALNYIICTQGLFPQRP